MTVSTETVAGGATALTGAPRATVLGAAVGIDIGGTKIDVALQGPSGRQVRRISTRAELGADQAVERALEAAALLAEQMGAGIAALVIAVPGAVHEGRIELAGNIPGLEDLDVLALAEVRFPGVSVELLNDLNAAATAQLADGLLPARGLGIVVGLGTGIAAGIVVDGVLRSGARGAAGEIGYALTRLDESPDAGAQATPLEQIAGGRAFDRLAAGFGLTDARALLDRAMEEAELAAAVLPRLDAVGRAIAFSRQLLDPEALVVFGGLSAHPLLRQRVEAVLAAHPGGLDPLRWLEPTVNASLEGVLHRAAALVERLDVQPDEGINR